MPTAARRGAIVDIPLPAEDRRVPSVVGGDDRVTATRQVIGQDRGEDMVVLGDLSSATCLRRLVFGDEDLHATTPRRVRRSPQAGQIPWLSGGRSASPSRCTAASTSSQASCTCTACTSCRSAPARRADRVDAVHEFLSVVVSRHWPDTRMGDVERTVATVLLGQHGCGGDRTVPTACGDRPRHLRNLRNRKPHNLRPGSRMQCSPTLVRPRLFAHALSFRLRRLPSAA
jgi:hypothetical protein